MEKMIKLLKQIISFGLVGGICFVIDYVLMLIFVEIFNTNYLVACALAFSISTVVNYLLSMRYVFIAINKMSKKLEFFYFVFMAIIGLILTEMFMAIFVEKIHVHYALSKIIVTAIVMIYNFITRKIMFEKKGLRIKMINIKECIKRIFISLL